MESNQGEVGHIFTFSITVPSIIFMVIDWWQSPHSKIALLVLNTFQPILKGETYRLFRWLKSIGINLACDDLNHLPISKLSSESFEFYMTAETQDNMGSGPYFRVQWTIGIEDEEIQSWNFQNSYAGQTKCTFFRCAYRSGVFHVHQLKNSRKLVKLYFSFKNDRDFLGHPMFKSSLIKNASYTVDSSRAQLLITRLVKIISMEMPILADLEPKRDWFYFHAVPTLDNLNGDLVLIKTQGECIAVGSPRYNIMDLRAILNRR